MCYTHIFLSTLIKECIHFHFLRCYNILCSKNQEFIWKTFWNRFIFPFSLLLYYFLLLLFNILIWFHILKCHECEWWIYWDKKKSPCVFALPKIIYVYIDNIYVMLSNFICEMQTYLINVNVKSQKYWTFLIL